MTCFIRFYEDLDSETGMRRGEHHKLQKDGTYKVEDCIVSHSNVPKFEGPINNEIYALYPFLTKINKTAVDILGKYFHIDRLQHSLKSSQTHWHHRKDRCRCKSLKSPGLQCRGGPATALAAPGGLQHPS